MPNFMCVASARFWLGDENYIHAHTTNPWTEEILRVEFWKKL